MKRLGFAFLLLAPAFNGCTCETTLTDVPKGKAVLGYAQTSAPPEAFLKIALPDTVLGTSTEVQLQLRNEGKAPLKVKNIQLQSDAELCPHASGEFAITKPNSSGGVRSF